MQTDYHIEDLVFQNETLVVYRVRDRDGTPLAIVRLRYDNDTLELLKGDRFVNALKELQSLSHNCLRPVLDGGLDPVDSFPWLAVRWWEGTLLSDRIKLGPLLSQEELDRIQNHGSNLIESLGPVGSTVSFAPSSVVTCGNDPAKLIDTFSVDYHAWFLAFSQDVHPATLSPSYQKLTDLLVFLRQYTEHTLVTSDLAPCSTLTQQPSTPGNASSTIALPSSTSTFPLKILFIITALLAAVGFFSWQVLNQRKDPLANSATETKETLVIKVKDTHVEDTPKTIAQNPPELSPTPRPPDDGGFLSADPTSPYLLDNRIGKWVIFHSEINEIDDDGHLIIPHSAIRVTLPPGSTTLAQNALNNEVTLRGFLASPTVLKIVNPDDLEFTYLLKKFYTVQDEKQVRGNFLEQGQIIPVQAIISELTKSGSGKTLYLQFRNEAPEFAAAIELKKAGPGLTEAYLESLVGKTIQVKGRPKTDTRGNRLSIIVTTKSQITIVE
ncbi:MAG: hypothetical protein ACJAQT_004966 [Akkermansiaceae bacterium]|jgi:hypothetical protein